ncbi:hypothetical protein FQN54_002067 [Arachnomyces sp. PD_36]|nr:hypothetical protein FQN54_002067 [Arachnomyces sp. PD_36]
MAENQATDQKFQLFAQCQLCIVAHPAHLDDDAVTKLSSMIEEHGGKVTVHRQPGDQLPIKEFTHIVSPTIDFASHDAARDALIPVVKPQWVYTSVLKSKLANPRQYSPDPKLFLNEVVLSCADIPEGDKEAIIGGVVAMGGLYSAKLASTVTHVVALTTDSDKCKLIQERKLNVKMVLPHWFDDCLKLGKRIDERPYTLPDPEILRLKPGTPVRTAENKDIIGASTPEPQNLPSPTTPSHGRRQLNVFEQKNVMLSTDLKIGSHLRGSIEDLIRQGGGSIVAEIDKADMFICRFREGNDYQLASRAGKDVGNLSWLYHLITHNTWTSPLRRLLHYPIPREGIPGFQGFKISLSNYAGEARLYLENLIAASGAECTKTLRQNNTHLITAHGNSEKCNAAKEWNLDVVNHLWLEDSYAKWKIQTISDPRYTHFPQRTNLGEVVGQTAFDKAALEKNFFPSDTESSASSKVMKQKDSNSLIVPNGTTTKAINPPPKPTAPKGTKKRKSSPLENEVTPKTAKTENKNGSEKKPQTPAISRFAAEGKENATPSSTSSRKSKDAAAARLHEIAPDIALYEKEKKRVGGVIYGGRRKSDQDAVVRPKRKSKSAEPSEESDMEEGVEVKRVKKTRPSITMELLLSGYKPWVENPKKENSDKQKLRDLGILVVQDPARCTHLAAPKIIRTHKFVNALAFTPKIVNSKFVTDCIEKEELLDPDNYPLEDVQTEKKYGFTLAQAEINARQNKNKLLSGKLIYTMEGIRGGFEIYKSIIETNGGQCALFKGRTGMTIPSGRAMSESNNSDNGEQDHAEEVYLISGTDTAHSKLWPRFRQVALSSRRVPKIVSLDWILDIAMSQEWRWTDGYELTDKDVVEGKGEKD